MYSGETQQAITWFATAREIDPYFDEAWYWRGLGEAYMIMHRHEDALATLTRSRARQYRFAALMAACHAELGDMDRARASVAECLTMRPGYSVGQFLQKERFKNPADAAQLAGSVRLAGLSG